MPVQHSQDENQSSWWIIELGANLQCDYVYTKPNFQSNQPKKKKVWQKEKNEVIWLDWVEKIKWWNKCLYNSMVVILRFTNRKGWTFNAHYQIASTPVEYAKIDSLVLCADMHPLFPLIFPFYFQMSNFR